MQRSAAWPAGSGLPGWRLRLLLWLVAGFGLVLAGKLFYLQVLQSESLGGKARAEHLGVREIAPPRGNIADRNGVLLAANRNADRLYAEPKFIRDPAAVAAALAPILEQPAHDLQRKLTGVAAWVSLATRLTPQQSEAVKKLKLTGIGLEPSPMRVYPNGKLASHVLGFTNFENVGSYGVEGQYDGYVTGEPGQITAERDAVGNWLSIGSRQIVPPKSGADVQLTIDNTIQYLAEEELQRTVKEQRAKGGTVIVMRPQTGEILAMAGYPSFEPEKFNAVDNAGRFVNPAIGRQYEPGSTFKIMTMAAGLSEGVITPDTRVNDPGFLNVNGFMVRNWDGRAHPNESMVEVLINSANVGASFVSTRVGKEAFYRKLQDFGFGVPTGVDLQGEAGGMLRLPSSKEWAPINLYTNSYGQGIGVTPLQLITAHAAVANGGLLMRPYIVSKVVRDGQVIKENKPVVVRRVLEPEVANTLKGMNQDAVEQGQYTLARTPGYTLAAKTGTASIPTADGGYDPKLTIASIVAYSPVKNPQFIVLLRIDEPKKSPWGSEVAAPAYRRLAERLYAYMDVPPDAPLPKKDKAR